MTPEALGVGIVIASIAASGGALYLLQYLYHKRDRSGAGWFMGNMASVAVFCLSYGLALLVFEPMIRATLGAVAFLCVCFMGPFFLAFGLDYTGRGDLIRTPLFGIVAGVPLLTVGLAVTNSVHGLVWTDFQLDPVLGLATATYTVQPWGIFALLFSIGTAAVGSLLLIGAILSYGPLYRREATAVILSTVPPTVGVLLWLFEVGPVPQLHLTAPLMLIHVALDAYAFVGTHMFETNPATQRMAERTGLDSLSDPVFVLDTEQQVVRVNDRTEDVFPTTRSTSLPVSLESVLGVRLETLRETGEITLDMNGGMTFAVSYTQLTDPGSDSVGSMIVLYDVTKERQRRQRLAVLNRILRHNLRNETTVISGYAELLEADLADPQQSTQAGTIVAASDRLHSIAEKVRSFEDIQDRVIQSETLLVVDIVDEIVQTYSDNHTEATITRTVTSADLRLHTDPVILSTLLNNLVENAVVHSESADPVVRIVVSEASEPEGGVCFEIRDNNHRIPVQEIETLRAGEETPLQHGQGIGLWIVYWCVRKLHGDLDFGYDDGNVLIVTLSPRQQ
ncbi:histidine kinase N-terminal 7TM domain-containing protein [Natranaeroarchaeum aerophilus]|uniref:histidine kinase n=1 Tax=Natranaeroarchaeum aerophilus TaxID=2917711 RepID=A0AAE3K6C9_9EURY|nr:histidine kinase N-terminal 7TM domain-containing protein [Natranaeroarchaeum aerophilus]MCL9812684.1 ATP-binding protein [Natranaeroarchaeum aerophilus]